MLISKRISRDTQFKIEQVLFKTFYYFCVATPSSLVLALGKKIGSLAWKLQIRKSTVLTNLKIAFGDRYSQEELLGIAAKCYRHFGEEMLRLLILEQESRRPLEDWIDVEGLEALKNREKPGGVLVGGHLGCWEVAGFVLPKLGEQLTVYTGTHSNKVADRWLNEIRARASSKPLGSMDDRTELYERTKTELVAILGDHQPPKAPVTIRFFGRETESAQGAPLLSLLNKVDFFYFSCVKKGKRLKVRFKKMEFEATSSRKQNVQLLAQAFFDELQADIENHPEQYFWMHRRWKKSADVNYEEKNTLF
ncbi:MAG: hypothetical protein GY866_09010 [Proteobacteria bacterium]|nr:hypothetical protein [Pseudomonadota bacterium]